MYVLRVLSTVQVRSRVLTPALATEPRRRPGVQRYRNRGPRSELPATVLDVCEH